ncbi:MAG: hypothetical protein ABI912_07240 [Actinomycetota bacterium]
MGKIRQAWLITGLVIVALLGAGFFLGSKPEAAKAKKIKAATAEQAKANAAIRGEIETLKTQAAGVIGKQNRLKQIAVLLPGDPALPRLVRSLTTVTQASGVDLVSLAPGALTPLLDVPAAAAAKPAADKLTATDSKAPVAAPPTAAAGGLFAMPVVLSMTGDFTQLQLFLSKIEKLDRAFVMDTVGIAPDATAAAAGAKKSGNKLTVSLTGRVFVKSAPVAAPPVKAPVGAATQK